MGLPEEVRVLGWGLSLERPTMIRFGLNNIRDLVGHKVSFLFFFCGKRKVLMWYVGAAGAGGEICCCSFLINAV